MLHRDTCTPAGSPPPPEQQQQPQQQESPEQHVREVLGKLQMNTDLEHLDTSSMSLAERLQHQAEWDFQLLLAKQRLALQQQLRAPAPDAASHGGGTRRR